jgi:hypothetical protein
MCGNLIDRRRIKMTTKDKHKRKPTKATPIVSHLKSLLSLDPVTSNFEDIAKKIRKYLLEICNKAFRNEVTRKNEPTRVACSKVLVALVPDSINAIKYWINRSTGKQIREIHFSLFCFLDDIPDLPGGKAFAEEIPAIIEDYLLKINTETAYAAFMAGDLLGDHWEPDVALPILMKVAKEAKYWVGRENAIGGLEHLFHNFKKSKIKRDQIFNTIRTISKNDRSENVRISAKLVLDRITKVKV